MASLLHTFLKVNLIMKKPTYIIVTYNTAGSNQYQYQYCCTMSHQVNCKQHNSAEQESGGVHSVPIAGLWCWVHMRIRELSLVHLVLLSMRRTMVGCVEILGHPSAVTETGGSQSWSLTIFSKPKFYKHILPIMRVKLRRVVRHWGDKVVADGSSSPTHISHVKFSGILRGNRLRMSREMWRCRKVERLFMSLRCLMGIQLRGRLSWRVTRRWTWRGAAPGKLLKIDRRKCFHYLVLVIGDQLACHYRDVPSGRFAGP
jgi:hypothetical protein